MSIDEKAFVSAVNSTPEIHTYPVGILCLFVRAYEAAKQPNKHTHYGKIPNSDKMAGGIATVTSTQNLGEKK